MSYALKYFYLAPWEKGGAHYKVEYFNDYDEVVARKQNLSNNIRVSTKSMKTYQTVAPKK
jgi:hypothetical protein